MFTFHFNNWYHNTTSPCKSCFCSFLVLLGHNQSRWSRLDSYRRSYTSIVATFSRANVLKKACNQKSRIRSEESDKIRTFVARKGEIRHRFLMVWSSDIRISCRLRISTSKLSTYKYVYFPIWPQQMRVFHTSSFQLPSTCNWCATFAILISRAV